MVTSPENDYLMRSINNAIIFLKVFTNGICYANCVLRTQPLGLISFFRSLILKLTIIGNKGIYAQSVGGGGGVLLVVGGVSFVVMNGR